MFDPIALQPIFSTDLTLNFCGQYIADQPFHFQSCFYRGIIVKFTNLIDEVQDLISIPPIQR